MSARLATDWKLFTPTVLILAFGLVMVYSASSVVAEVIYKKDTLDFATKQVLFAIVGVALMVGLKTIDYRRFNKPHWIFVPIGLVILLLIGVLFADPNAHRWYSLPGFKLQPSELAKPAVILFVAWFVARREGQRRDINGLYSLAPPALVVGSIAALVAIGDLGTAIILMVPAIAVFFVAGIERRYFYMTAALCVLITAGFIIHKPYRLFRFMPFFGITETTIAESPRLKWLAPIIAESGASRDPGYQPYQARLAVATGGLNGRGLGQGKQKLGYLPEAHNDFIFGAFAEEAGFTGCVLLIGGYLLIFWRGLHTFWRTTDRFGRYLALGIISLIITQALFNISVVIGLAPTKGIPLPLFSYGGSSLVCTLALFGLLFSVSDRAAEH
ncbi:MAG: putative lipid II flippase FtsW [Bryobacteraceae bacterium]|nr:putative lipid II flippase FtsW [Bryobacteraceae bacterium]